MPKRTCKQCQGSCSCKRCNGTGRIIKHVFAAAKDCPKCGGSGACPACNGRGYFGKDE